MTYKYRRLSDIRFNGRIFSIQHVDGQVNERRNSSASTMELGLSYINPLMCNFLISIILADGPAPLGVKDLTVGLSWQVYICGLIGSSS